MAAPVFLLSTWIFLLLIISPTFVVKTWSITHDEQLNKFEIHCKLQSGDFQKKKECWKLSLFNSLLYFRATAEYFSGSSEISVLYLYRLKLGSFKSSSQSYRGLLDAKLLKIKMWSKLIAKSKTVILVESTEQILTSLNEHWNHDTFSLA